MVVTLLEISTEVRLEQPRKAPCPMVVTLLGMVTEVRLEQPKNALSPILITLEGIFVFLHPAIKVLVAVSIIALQLFRGCWSHWKEF